MALKYKEGDRVRIKSLDWYNENKDEDGDVPCDKYPFVSNMSVFCGKILTIDVDFEDGTYLMKEDTDGFVFTNEMIECKVEEEMPLNIDDFQDDNEIGDVIDEYVYRLKDNECQINLPKGYIFKDENGNVINATKIVLEKKKKEYPKTYVECCKIVGIKLSDCYIQGYKSPLLEDLQELLICRDTYWKIAGEEMGLDKPWEPDWNDEKQDKYGFYNEVKYTIINSAIFVFPTAEMRDVFYENFKELIKSCKELL